MCVMKHASGDPSLNVVNTFHFTIQANDATAMGNIESTLIQFLWGPCDQYLSNDFSGAVVEHRWYRLTDPQPRVPVRVTTPHTLVTGSDRLPSEIALCASYHGTYSSGTPNARKRGRFFFGPLATATNTGSTGRPTSALRTALKDAMAGIKSFSDLDNDWTWVQYSPTGDLTSTVTGGWVDDAWDVQRRRGQPVTSKTTW